MTLSFSNLSSSRKSSRKESRSLGDFGPGLIPSGNKLLILYLPCINQIIGGYTFLQVEDWDWLQGKATLPSSSFEIIVHHLLRNAKQLCVHHWSSLSTISSAKAMACTRFFILPHCIPILHISHPIRPRMRVKSFGITHFGGICFICIEKSETWNEW